MTFEEFRDFAETKFGTDWTSTPIEFENIPESTALVSAKESKSPWVRFTIRDGDGQRKTIGSDSPVNRYVGVIIVQIFVAQKTGTATARGYADDVAADWNGFTQPCLEFRTPSIAVPGEIGGWFQINVSIPFQNDEIT